jgi:hypothetical protein
LEASKLEKSIFELEVREKKNQAYQNKSKTGSKGGSSSRKGMRTAYDFMSNKEKKNLSGEVRVGNMYTTILNWNEWETKDKETQKNLLIKWREIYSNEKIMNELSQNRRSKLNSQSFNELVTDLGCPKKPRLNSVARKAKTKVKSPVVAAEIQSSLEFAPEVPKKEIQEKIESEVVRLMTKGLHLEYNGTYDVESLNRLFTKLQLLVDGEPSKYNISLSLSEVQEN